MQIELAKWVPQCVEMILGYGDIYEVTIGSELLYSPTNKLEKYMVARQHKGFAKRDY